MFTDHVVHISSAASSLAEGGIYTTVTIMHCSSLGKKNGLHLRFKYSTSFHVTLFYAEKGYSFSVSVYMFFVFII